MNNLFKGLEITVNEVIDNTERNAAIATNPDPIIRHFSEVRPDKESGFTRVVETLADWLRVYNGRFEREFTKRENGMITLYISFAGTIPAIFKDEIAKYQERGLFTATYGSMKVDASFKATKQ